MSLGIPTKNTGDNLTAAECNTLVSGVDGCINRPCFLVKTSNIFQITPSTEITVNWGTVRKDIGNNFSLSTNIHCSGNRNVFILLESLS